MKETDMQGRRVELRFHVDPWRVLLWFLWITFALSFLSVAVNLVYRYAGLDQEHYIRELFDVDREQNIPTWWNVSEFFVVAGLAALVGITGVTAHARRYRRAWIGLGVIALAMSIDELASIHEALTTNSHRLLHVGGAGWQVYAWVGPALVIVALVGLAYARFALALPRRVGVLLVLAASFYVFSAAIVEVIDGKVNGPGDHPLRYGKIAVTTIQEFGEQSSLAVAVYGLLLMFSIVGTRDRIRSHHAHDAHSLARPRTARSVLRRATVRSQ